MDTKKLRQKILDLAIRGKLVPQDPNDEPASVLLQRIRKEKERLIKEGKIKRSKQTASDNEFEAPFEIPESWEWCLLPDLCSIPITDGTHQTPTYTDKEHGIPFISSKDVTSQKINWNNIKFITRDIHESLYKRIAPQRDDILLAKNGTTGVAALVEDDFIFDIYVTLAVIRPIKELVLPIYLWRVINCSFCKKQFDNHLTGIGLPNLHLTDIKKTIIPLPPLAEQKRIATEVERWFSLIDTLETAKEDLQTSIEKAKSKILDLAIHGKLVPQDPADEPAIELLKRINPKFTPCDDANDENLPDGLCPIPLGCICTLKEGEVITNKEYPYIDVRGLRTGNFITKQSGKYVEKGTTLILVDGENSGEVFHTPIEGYQGSTMKVLDINPNVDAQYVLYFVKLYQKELRENKVGSAIPHLNKKMFRELEIPIPPYNEQQRIVAKIEELFAVLDGIKESIEK